jgi:type IV fimbrial biogenesis protein FimT
MRADKRRRGGGRRGFTLIELMVVVAVVGVILTLAVPSFLDYLLAQRLRGVHAQLVTDMQFARSEAVSRNTLLRVNIRSNDALTCYTLYTSRFNSRRCDCTLGAGSACTAGETVEVKTESVPRSRRVTFQIPEGQPNAFAFDPITGGLISIPQDNPSAPLDSVAVSTAIDTARTLQVVVSRTGRPTVCAPTGSTMPEAACP